MKRAWLFMLLMCLACAAPTGQSTVQATEAPAYQPARTAATDTAMPTSILTLPLRRGINLGNMLEAPVEGEWGLLVQEEYFDLIRAAGFDFVRLPVRWSSHMGPAGHDDGGVYQVIDPAFLARVDEVVGWALQSGLTVILDFHHYEELMAEPNEEQFLELWGQIAEHYQDQPPQLIFELLNEPTGQLDAALWNTYLADALQVVRTTNPDREVIIGPANWNAYERMGSLELPDDPHIIATFHYYEPFQFTHQGAEWVGGVSEGWLGTRWEGNEAQKSEVRHAFDSVKAWSEREHVGVLLGEFGAYSRADMDSRVRWTAFVRQTAEERGFAWAYWEFASGFGAYDPDARAWRWELLEALIPQ